MSTSDRTAWSTEEIAAFFRLLGLGGDESLPVATPADEKTVVRYRLVISGSSDPFGDVERT